MAKFLLCWEIGSGLGHVGRLAPVAQRLAGQGHDVAVALREPHYGPTLFPGCQLFAVPQQALLRSGVIVEPSTFADILHNAGGSSPAALEQIVVAWREIFDRVKPDVVVLDFSPLALLAAQGYSTKTVLLATGHACPPDVTPLPDCCPWRNNYPDRLQRTESSVLEALNEQLASQGELLLERVAQLFTRATTNLLTTFRELDHYPHRPPGRHEYVGVWSELPAAKPDWPKGRGPRVFAYLKSAPLAAQVLAELDRRGTPAVAFVPDADAMGMPNVRGSVRISREPLDMDAVADECDLAILHSGHNATARLLLAGKPILAIPLSGEQQIVAASVARLGAGDWLHPEQLATLSQFLDRLIADPSYRAAASEFSRLYRDWTPERQLQRVVERLVDLVGR